MADHVFFSTLYSMRREGAHVEELFTIWPRSSSIMDLDWGPVITLLMLHTVAAGTILTTVMLPFVKKTP